MNLLRPIPGGFLVAIEGIDGAGKTSVAARLAQWCGERGLLCAFSKEPTSLLSGQRLRHSTQTGRLALEDEIALFEEDRKAHIARTIVPGLAEGAIVLLDRYYWSTAAYQGARGASVEDILRRHASFAPTPHLVLVLDVPAGTGVERIQRRGDKPNLFEQREALEAARAIFLDLVSQSPYAVRIDATGPADTVAREALKAFQKAAVERIAASNLPPEEKEQATRQFFGEDPALPSERRR